MSGTWQTDLGTRGWACFRGTVEDVLAVGQERGWNPVPIRRGDPILTELRPLTSKQAHPNSHSSRVGLGAQPLHTDGAHLDEPPDLVALVADRSHPTPTLVWVNDARRAPLEDLEHGVFAVSDGCRRFSRVAYERGRIRFDPFCMTPGDARARRVVEFFGSVRADCYVHRWSENISKVLLLDNRRTLHARGAVAAEGPPRRLQRVAFMTGGET